LTGAESIFKWFL